MKTRRGRYHSGMFRPVLACLLMSTSMNAAPAAPTADQVRREMGIPSTDDVRGQRDAVGYATTPEAMAKVWRLAEEGPTPESFGFPAPPPGVAAVIGPHDDYVYAGRVYRRAYPLVTAKTVIVVGVFHGYRRFEARDRFVFDRYRAWRSPDGEIAISSLRQELLDAMPADMVAQDNAAHDSEHSIEGIAYFLKHARPDVEIVPVIVPGASFERLTEISGRLGDALSAAIKRRGWTLGRDVAIVVSTDGTHYGDDFRYSPYGPGGIEAFQKAMAHDRALVRDTLGREASPRTASLFFSTVVDPAKPDQYRVPWCGRFSVTAGLLLIDRVSRALGMPLKAVPLALGVSVDTPELAVRDVGVGPTAPANLYHFVTLPAVAYVKE
jgi:AmmeMemoRadiSam system protein B